MKKNLILIFLFWGVISLGQSVKNLETKVSEVTVFIEGAQVVRKKQVEITKGITELKFTNLSPYINPESISVKAVSGVTILSVSHQIDFLQKSKSAQEIELLEKSIEDVENKIQNQRVLLSVVKDNIDLLNRNKDLSGKNNPITATNLQQVLDFYNQRITALKIKENEHTDNIATLIKNKKELESKKSVLVSQHTNLGEILVKISAERSLSVPFEVSYVVSEASWKPSYDLRASDITRPIELIYKANITQNTKEDWENVKLVLSSANPSINNELSELKTYFLGYHIGPPSYQKNQNYRNVVKGIVLDEQGMPLVGASVVVRGSSIGVSTDFDGNFSLSTNEIPNKLNGIMLDISYIGYKTKTLPASPIMNIRLEEEQQQLEEVVITGKGSQKKAVFTGTVQESVAPQAMQDYIAMASSHTPTNVQFEIKTPYTIKSDNKNYVVDMQSVTLNTDYQYHTIPKIESFAYLLGYVTDWQQHNLLDGEASIFFEDTYIGKTQLSAGLASDTLKISLGQDKKIAVERKKIKDFVSNQFIGGKREITKLWKTTIRNHKNVPIKLVLFDQIPISTQKEIEVISKNISNGKLDKETGKIQWNFTILPSQKQEIDLEYSIKHPKDKSLYIE